MYGKGGGAVINGRTEVKVEVVETEGEEGEEGGGALHTPRLLPQKQEVVS